MHDKKAERAWTKLASSETSPEPPMQLLMGMLSSKFKTSHTFAAQNGDDCFLQSWVLLSTTDNSPIPSIGRILEIAQRVSSKNHDQGMPNLILIELSSVTGVAEPIQMPKVQLSGSRTIVPFTVRPRECRACRVLTVLHSAVYTMRCQRSPQLLVKQL